MNLQRKHPWIWRTLAACHIFSPWPLLRLYFYAMGQGDGEGGGEGKGEGEGEEGGGGNEAKAPHPLLYSAVAFIKA